MTAVFFVAATECFGQSACRSVADDRERLACYDLENGVSLVEQDKGEHGKWEKSVEISQLTDDKNVFLVLVSENDISARFGSPGPATIMLRCSENTTAAFFLFNGHFMSDIQGYGRVEYRIDDKKMRTVNTSASTDHEALGLWSGAKAIPFIKELLEGSQLVVRATPHSESAVTATFDIRGIDNAVEELRETCGW
ncbi:MAG: hypothetical protein KDE03_14935 [Rhodobacteraceae bacterium]|nr:hypothetical protein [Paracoccaceae bacterium]